MIRKLVSKVVHHGGTVTLFDQGVVSATNFLTGLIIGRVCSKEEFGLYMLGLSVMLVVYELQTALITTPYMIHSPHLTVSEKPYYTGSTLVHQGLFALMAAFLFVGGGLLLRGGVGPGEASPVLSALAIAGIFMMLREYVRRLCFAKLLMRSAMVLDIGVSSLQLLIIGLLAWLGVLTAVKSLVAIGLAGAAGAVIWFIANRSAFRIERIRIKRDFITNWTFGRWVFASGFLWSIGMQCYPWILTFYHGTESAGVWAACLGVVNLANPVMLGIQNYLGPSIATSYAATGFHGLGSYVAKTTAVFAGMILPFTVIVVFFGGVLVSMLYGAKYEGFGTVVAVLGGNVLAMALAFPVSRALFAARRADLDCGVNMIILLYLFTAGLWMVRQYGPAGAAGALLTANILATILRTVVFMRLVTVEQRRRADG